MTARSTVYLWPGCLLLLSPGIRNQPHRHLAGSLLVSLDGVLEFGAGAARVEAPAVLAGPDLEQRLDSRGAIAVLHVDPDHPHWRRLSPVLDGAPWTALDGAAFAASLPALRAQQAGGTLDHGAVLVEQLVAVAAAGRPPAPPPDPRIAKLCALLRAAPPDRIDAGELARAVHLSESRLMHLFKAEIGVPLRRFVLALKLQHAIHQYRDGMTFAELAVAAGFYDQPHLVRTAREMLDFLPSALGDRDAVTVVRNARLRPA